MPTLSRIKEVTLIALQEYPEIAARYNAGDPTVTAQIYAFQHVLAEMGRDIDQSELEPFTKSRDATILADASNKGILPFATPLQHMVIVQNNATVPVSLQSGRVFEDGQGRPWRFLQYVDIPAGGEVQVLTEQSEERKVTYTALSTESFHQYPLSLQEDLSLVSLNVKDHDNNTYNFVTRWMNTKADDYAIILKTNSARSIILEFGDSTRFGRTLQANTSLEISIIESYGEVEATNLKEAMLSEVNSPNESKINIKFLTGGVVRMGADPLSIEQMRLLVSYPAHDENAVFLGDFDFLVRKKFMNRTFYSNVWNESIHEKYFGASLDNINHLFVCIVPKHTNEMALIQDEIKRLITQGDNLYSGDNTVFMPVEERLFHIEIKGTLAPSHNKETVQDQIKTLLLSNYGREKIATSYHISDGFNLQEIIRLINKYIIAFQDRQSDFKIYTEDLSENPVKPNQWLFIDETSISFEFQRSSGVGGGMWTVL